MARTNAAGIATPTTIPAAMYKGSISFISILLCRGGGHCLISEHIEAVAAAERTAHNSQLEKPAPR
jgi:hypothetical protein